MSDIDLSLDELLSDAEATPKQETVWVLLASHLVDEYHEVQARIQARALERAGDTDAEITAAVARVEAGDDRLSTTVPGLDTGEPDDGVQQTAQDAARDPEQDRLDELAEKIKKRWIGVRLVQMPAPAYNDLLMAHPPRRDENGYLDPRDAGMFNSSTFYDPLLRASIKKPVFSDAQFARFLGKLSSGQYDQLANAAARVNKGRHANIPFSPAG